MNPLLNVSRYSPPGDFRTFAPPPSGELMRAKMGVGSMVIEGVTVSAGVSAAPSTVGLGEAVAEGRGRVALGLGIGRGGGDPLKVGVGGGK